MAGLDGIKNASLAEAKSELKSAKALPKSNLEEKKKENSLSNLLVQRYPLLRHIINTSVLLTNFENLICCN